MSLAFRRVNGVERRCPTEISFAGLLFRELINELSDVNIIFLAHVFGFHYYTMCVRAAGKADRTLVTQNTSDRKGTDEVRTETHCRSGFCRAGETTAHPDAVDINQHYAIETADALLTSK